MSKTVCSFKSPYHDQYAESHAGGRSALALRFADYDALVLTGKAERLSVVALGSRHLEMRDVHYMRGLDQQSTGKMLRRMFGGTDFACVLGQEMAGYATGEVFFTSQALRFRHSHLDSGGYSYDQKHEGKNAEDAVTFLTKDELDRVFLTSMVSCLFAREVYKPELLAECLASLGIPRLVTAYYA